MSNPNPGHSAGGIGLGPSAGESPSDADWNDQSDPLNGKGQTPDDAATAAYDTWDEKEHGISEGDRKNLGGYLKHHADAAGTDIKTGLGALVETAAVLRNGNPEAKRSMIGNLLDTYDIRPMPSAETHDEFGDPVGQPLVSIASEAEATEAVSNFIAANPVAGDEQIQAAMIEGSRIMQSQGLQPHLPTLLRAAVDADPRYSDSARQAQDAAHVAQARKANVQVSGGGSVSPSSSQAVDVGAILDELIPR